VSALHREPTARRDLAALWALAIVATAVIFRHPSWLAGGYDWRYFESSMEAARRSIVWFHELPLYNPYMCGGEPQLANPQSVAGSPAFLLVALFGTAVGEKLMFVLFVGLGLDGCYRLARHLGIDRVGAASAAIVFGLSGWVVAHFGVGHVSFFGATLIPHAIYFYRRGLDDRRFAIALGAVMTLVVAQGGTSTAAMAAIALGAVAIADAIASRRSAPLQVLALGAIAALLLGAYRLLPALEFALDHPRHVTETDGQSLLELLRAGLLWSGGKPAGHRYGFHEYAWRVSYIGWPLALVGLGVRGSRRLALALFVAGAGIALGDGLPYGPWWLMRRIPVLRDLRVPSRYVLLCGLGLSLLAGLGASRLLTWSGQRARVFAALLLCALAIEGVLYSDLGLLRVFDLAPPRIDRRAVFYQEKGHWSRMLDLVFSNRGDIGCDEEAPLTRALALDEGPGPQVRLDDPLAGRVELHSWSPDRLQATVDLVRPADLLVNLNWNEHWKANVGEVVRHGGKWPADRDGGRLAVRLPAQNGLVTVVYRPTSFLLGSALSLASLLGLLLWTWASHGNPSRKGRDGART
jgi:hypothetical protein